MKILHVCLAAFYIDNYSYQENILPRMHKKMGHDVRILASTETYINGKTLGYISASEYENEDSIRVKRIPYVSYLPLKIAKKLRIYSGVYESLCEFKPDFIFLHDVQFLSISQIVRYLKENPNVRIVVDGHTDFINSARGVISKYILHGIIYKYCAKKILPFAKYFYGTLPARVSFFKDFYKIPPEKVKFLPMGVDDDLAEKFNQQEKIIEQKHSLNISDDSFLIVTGGKINTSKYQILTLMEAIRVLNNPRVKLLIFGSIEDSLKHRFNSLLSENIIYLGWATVEDAYKYFSMADLVVFPSTHSVYWEQAAGLGKPLVVKHWEGITHVDLGGNVTFLHNDTKEEMVQCLNNIILNPSQFETMKNIAQEKGITFFSYKSIAARALH